MPIVVLFRCPELRPNAYHVHQLRCLLSTVGVYLVSTCFYRLWCTTGSSRLEAVQGGGHDAHVDPTFLLDFVALRRRRQQDRRKPKASTRRGVPAGQHGRKVHAKRRVRSVEARPVTGSVHPFFEPSGPQWTLERQPNRVVGLCCFHIYQSFLPLNTAGSVGSAESKPSDPVPPCSVVLGSFTWRTGGGG